MTAERLAELASESAGDAPDVSSQRDATTTIWSVGGRPIVVLSGDTLEFRLDPMVGAAARRTPGTTASSRGDDWVAFRPSELDQYAEDRVRAWFAAAHRRAIA